MAIPTVLNNSDFPTLDFTDSNSRYSNLFEALKSGLTTLGWTLEFSTEDSAVFSNAGSGYMFKILPDTNATYCFIETAQSWTDIDTPVNQLVNQRLHLTALGSSTSKFQIVGDDQRFYCTMLVDQAQDSGNARAFFMGDIVPFNNTDPYVFLYLGQIAQPISTTFPSSSSNRGVVLNPVGTITSGNSPQSGSLFGSQNGEFGDTPVSMVSPGYSNNVPGTTVPDQINNDQPTILLPAYIYNVSASDIVDGTAYGNRARGILPGYHFSLAPSRILTVADRLSQTTVAGVSVIPYLTGSTSGRSNSAIVLNDWGNLL